MAQEIPKKMKAVVFTKRVGKFDVDLKSSMEVREVDVPVPKPGQVLVKIHYSTVNPSDTAFVKGMYGKKFEPPCMAGFEASGVVVQNGGGMMGYRLVGKRVALFGSDMWAEYALADAMGVVELPNDFPLEKAANTLVNPYTVLGFVEVAKNDGHTSMVHTAAASAVGRMLIRYAKSEGVDVVCVVRREDQAEICRKEGAKAVVDTSKEGWQAELKEVLKANNTRIGFDAVGGELTAQVLGAMPRGSTMHVYGALSGSPTANAGVGDLIFQGKSLKGFWLTEYIKSKNLIGMIMWTRKVVSMLQSELSTTVSKTVTLDDLADGILFYIKNMSAGKVLIKIAGDETEGKQAEETAAPASDSAAAATSS
eukprot:comp8123_c0_seq1/m.3602 comp8123_c0_seq1/g.3602  ORF comp8123_c0_seq1/g.3602 comp8123_c0_seq1/m.3602 type:complete len:366 (-) comp8123_c0_seq1:126-1223(-)